MGKHFRLTITRVFRSRRSKHSPPPTTKKSAIQIPPAAKHRRSSSFKHHVYSAFLCRCAYKSDDDDEEDNITKPLDFHWRISEHEWNDKAVAAVQQNDGESPRQKIYNSSVSGDSDDTDILAPTMPPPPPKKRRSRKKKTTTSKHNRVSASSADSGLYFSSEEREREETETLVSSSSRSFSNSTDSEFNPQLETIREKPNTTTRRYKKRTKRKTTTSSATSSRRSVTSSSAPESESPARLSVFKKLIPCAVEGKVKESFAVVKKSVDPYDDFYKSMSDMIYEKEMFDEKELEQLLQCFLSLNSPQYHGVIVQAFAAIWNSMFSSVTAASSTPTITS